MIRYVAVGLSTVSGVLSATRALAIAGFAAAAALAGAYLLSCLRPAQATIVPSQGNSTYLLFTFITNDGSYDTQFIISNTSADPFGTTQQSGTCTLNWYGAFAPATPTTTPSVAAGMFYYSAASVLAPNFQGYMIATCNFRYAHGVAYLASGNQIISSVPAQVIPMVPRPNNENLNN
jgi:hypothetical protein